MRRAHGHGATEGRDPLVAIAFGGGTAYSALTNPLSRETLGWKRIPTVVVGAIAILLALLSLVASFAARE